MSRLIDKLRALEQAGAEANEVEVAQIIATMESLAVAAAENGKKSTAYCLDLFHRPGLAPLPCRAIDAVTKHFEAQGLRIFFVKERTCNGLLCTCNTGGKKHFAYTLHWD